MKRLASIDIFRGLTIFLMILVNTQSGGGFNCLTHASGYGWTLADLVYPSFIFIMGASIYLSMRKRTNDSSAPVIYRILHRTAMLFLMGILFNWIPFTQNLFDVRLLGVLQRIALIYLCCSLLTLKIKSPSILILISVGILIAYWLMTFIYGYDLVDQFDLLIIGTKHMYTPTHDPEGLLSTLPAITNALWGFISAKLLSENNVSKGIKTLAVLSVLLILTAQLLNITILPIYKTYCSSSFALFTSGIAIFAWIILHAICDLWGKQNWGIVFKVFGTNSIVCYMLSELLAAFFWEWKIADKIVGFYKEFMNTQFTSLCWGLTVLLICIIVVYPLYKKRIFLKL